MAKKRKKKSINPLIFVLIGVAVFVGGSILFAITMFALKYGRGGLPVSGKERILPAAEAPFGAPLRSHPRHPWVKLISAKQEVSPGNFEPLNMWMPGKVVVIDYESSGDFMTHPTMNHCYVQVILKNEQGDENEYGNVFDRRKFDAKGTLLLSGVSMSSLDRFKFTPNMEVFVVLDDQTNGLFDTKRFKISNSLCIGRQAGVTLAREWKPEEAASLEKMATSPEPVLITFGNAPAGKFAAGQTATAQISTGQTAAGPKAPTAETPKVVSDFGGPAPPGTIESPNFGAAGGRKFQYAKANAPLLGFACRFGQWDGHPSIGMIRPLFSDGVAPTFPHRLCAKPGYAVGGVNLETSPFVSGIQLIYMKVNGNRLDPGDQYLSEWIRAEKVTGEAQPPILSDGKLVIGLHGNAGSVINTLGLIYQP